MEIFFNQPNQKIINMLYVPPPTASEIGEKFGGHLTIAKTDKGRWIIRYWWGVAPTGLRTDVTDWHENVEHKLCDALAKMWIYLKSNNLFPEEKE